MYPFSSHWPSYSPGNGSSSSSGKSSSPTNLPSSNVKTSATSLATTSSPHSGIGLNWWHPSVTDMHHFSSPPWSGHEHHELHTVSRDTGSSIFHSSHSRNGAQYYPSGHHNHSHAPGHGHNHSHSYHHGRSSHVHGGTLIHFPHSSGHHSHGSKDESSPADQSLSPNHKETTDQKAGFTIPSDSHDRERTWDDVARLPSRHETFSPHLRQEKPSAYIQRVEGILDDEAIGSKSPAEEGRYEEKEKTDRVIDEKGKVHRISYDERSRGGMGTPSTRSDRHDSSHTGNPLYISSVSEKALASAKASYLNKDSSERAHHLHPHEEKRRSPYPFSSSMENDFSFSKTGIISPNAHEADSEFDPKRDYHLVKHDHRRDHGQYGDSNSGSLQSERMNRAEATREWVNKQPALHISSNHEHYAVQENRCKKAEASPLNRKSESSKVGAAKSGKNDKCLKKEQHYESPLNSTLSRYSSGAHAIKPETEHAQKRGRNPFNVDFLSVSSDAESHSKRDLERHYHVSSSQDTSSDRVSVIKSSAMSGLNMDMHMKKGLDGTRGHVMQHQPRELYEKSCLNRPSSLLDSPGRLKPVAPLSGKPRSFMKPDDLSPKNSDSESSSGDESEDQMEDEQDSSKQLAGNDWELDQNGTENDGELALTYILRSLFSKPPE